MKKNCCVLLILLGMLACAACSAEAPAPLSSDDFLFAFGGEAYALGIPAAPLIKAVEAVYGPFHVFEVDSCLYEGMDRELENVDLLLGTYPIGPDGADVLETIMVVGGDYRTPRGIGIGDSSDAVVSAYGENFVFDYDLMIYSLGDYLTQPVLVFVLDLGTDTVSSYYMMQNTGL